jgi:hypothetical protein
LRSPYLEEFLSSRPKTLAEYYFIHSRFNDAAVLLVERAKTVEGHEVSISERLDLLQEAVAACRQCGNENLLLEANQLISVAELQLEALGELADRVERGLLSDYDPDSIRYALDVLEFQLPDMNFLFHDVMSKFGLFRSLIAVQQAFQSNIGEDKMSGYWYKALCDAANPRDCFEELVMRYANDPFVFPLRGIIAAAEKCGITDLPEVLVAAGIDAASIWQAYWPWYSRPLQSSEKRKRFNRLMHVFSFLTTQTGLDVKRTPHLEELLYDASQTFRLSRDDPMRRLLEDAVRQS